jgi:hypothetical protein
MILDGIDLRCSDIGATDDEDLVLERSFFDDITNITESNVSTRILWDLPICICN